MEQVGLGFRELPILLASQGSVGVICVGVNMLKNLTYWREQSRTPILGQQD